MRCKGCRSYTTFSRPLFELFLIRASMSSDIIAKGFGSLVPHAQKPLKVSTIQYHHSHTTGVILVNEPMQQLAIIRTVASCDNHPRKCLIRKNNAFVTIGIVRQIRFQSLPHLCTFASSVLEATDDISGIYMRETRLLDAMIL